jgi:hypothetical protein
MSRYLLVLSVLLALVVTGGCAKDKNDATATAEKPAGSAMPRETGAMRGPVLETMDAGTYTYVKVRTAQGEVWAAAPTTVVAVGDEVTLPQGMLMKNFASPSLDRTFPEIYFVNSIDKAGASTPAPGHGTQPGNLSGAETGAEPGVEHAGAVMGGKAVAAGTVARAEGGRTVAEVHAERAQLAGQRVKVRGQVVKSTSGVMGRNWLHIQDGSAEDAHGDLTITTDSGGVKVGDVVLVEGTAAVDRDFGAGYRYEVLLEEATVKVEQH